MATESECRYVAALLSGVIPPDDDNADVGDCYVAEGD